MMIELAHFCLIVAFFVAFIIGIFSMYHVYRGSAEAIFPLLKKSSLLIFILLLSSFLLLINGFLNDDFSVRYIAAHSNRHLDTFYKIGAAWGGHEGSLLLWALLLSAWQWALSYKKTKIETKVNACAVGILSLIASGFFLFLLFTSNPFERLIPPPANGADLNPLLQDIGLILHPPLLYLGYVGFAPVFALTVATLLQGRVDGQWAKNIRPWALIAWIFLTFGIVLGSWWAYNELGWGGWWFWDPVENASLMPWLAGSALLHSLAIVEKRALFKHWAVLLAISTFSLSLLGTFLVRSGVLTSVHAFASDPTRGVFILIFLASVVGFALWIYLKNTSKLQQENQFSPLSKETSLLLNNILLISICFTVLLGTLFPLLSDVLQWGKFSVGAPYFNRVLTPIWLILLLILPLGIVLRWKKDQIKRIHRLLWRSFAISLFCAILLPFYFGEWKWGIALTFSLAIWITLLSVIDIFKHFKSYQILGMNIAHIGVAIFSIGASVVSHYDHTADRLIYPQKSVSVKQYQITFRQLEGKKTPNYQALIGHFELKKKEQIIGYLKAEKRQYASSEMPMTEAAIIHTLREDIYLSMGELRGDNPEKDPWSIRIYIKPLMNWVWFGCVLMALGGLIAMKKKKDKS